MDQNHDHLIQIAPSEPDECFDSTDEADVHEVAAAMAEISRRYREIEGNNSHIDPPQISTLFRN